MSEDALTNPEKIMVLIQGSGVVRAGQWARRLIINEDLNSGTQIPFINRAKEVGLILSSSFFFFYSEGKYLSMLHTKLLSLFVVINLLHMCYVGCV